MTQIFENELEKKRKLSEVEAIMFDVDGTLADSWKLGFDATQVVLRKNGIPLITEELYHECTKYSTPERLARHVGLDPGYDENFWEVGQKLAREFDDLYVRLVNVETAGFFEGIKKLIVDITCLEKGVKLAALTNACVAYAHAVLKTNCPVASNATERISTNQVQEIYSKFESIHGADTVAKPKPHPDGLHQCCEDLNVPAEKCVYVGDSPSDAVAAKSSGMIAIGVLWGSHPEEAMTDAPFDFLCKNVDELRSLLIDQNI